MCSMHVLFSRFFFVKFFCDFLPGNLCLFVYINHFFLSDINIFEKFYNGGAISTGNFTTVELSAKKFYNGGEKINYDIRGEK